MRADYKSSGGNAQLKKAFRSIGVRQKPLKEKVTLIDVTRENDSLLPSATPSPIFSKDPETFNDPATTVGKENKNTEVKEQEISVRESLERSRGRQHDTNLTESSREITEGLNGADRVIRLGKKTRSARARNNLRKSLAWDKAFSTCEGVLDIDELPFVTKTPKKPLELHPLEIPEILEKVSLTPLSVRKLPPAAGAASSSDITPRPQQRPVLHLETTILLATPTASGDGGSLAATPSGLKSFTSSPGQGPVVQEDSGNLKSPTKSIGSVEGSSSGAAPSNRAGGTKTLNTKTSKLESKASASAGGLSKQDTLKATRLRLPNTLTGKKGKIDTLKPVTIPSDSLLRRTKSSSSALSPSAAGAAISNKVSAVSKKVKDSLKDTLGKALAGSFGGSPKLLKAGEGQAVKSPLGSRANIVEESVVSPGTAASLTLKNARRFFSGKSADTNKKKEVQEEINKQDVNSTGQPSNGVLVSNSKVLSPGKEAASLSKKGTESKSFFSRKKSGPTGSEASRVDSSNHVRAAQTTKGNSSSLRMPSPKMGFFDKQVKPTTGNLGDHSERGSGAALENSSSLNIRKGLPPRPQQNLLPSRAGRPVVESNSATVARERANSANSSAPSVKQAKGLASAVSAPTSPHKPHQGMVSPGPYKKVVTGFGIVSQRSSDHRKPSTLRNDPDAFQNLMPESRDVDSDKQTGLKEDVAQPPVNNSASSAPTSPHKFHQGMVSPGPHKKVVTGSGLASQRSDQRKAPSVRTDPNAFQNLKPELRATDSDGKMPFVDLVGPPEDLSQSQAMGKFQSCPKGHEAVSDKKAGRDKSPSKATVSPVSRARLVQPDWCTADSAPLSSSPPSAGSKEMDSSSCRVASMVEDIGEHTGRVSKTENAGSTRDGSEELVASSSKDPSVIVKHSMLGDKLDAVASQDSARVRSVLSAYTSDSERCSVGISEALEMNVRYPAQEIVKLEEAHSRTGNCEAERNLSNNLAVQRAGGKEDSSQHPEARNTLLDDISSFLKGELVREDSATAITSFTEAISPEGSRNISWTGDSKNVDTTMTSEERVPDMKSSTPIRSLERGDATFISDNCVESPSHWSDWPILTPAIKKSLQPSPLRDQTLVPAPSEGLPCTASVIAENGQVSSSMESAESSHGTTSSVSSDVQKPLTVNIGELNGSSRPGAPARKEGNLLSDFDEFAFETTSGQENKRGSDGLIESPHLRKPKQRKPNFTQNFTQPEYADLYSEERLRALEAAGAESLKKKTGAVQHSPPNKQKSPNGNPWSPVKRNGHLPIGPFDCTKKHSSVLGGK